MPSSFSVVPRSSGTWRIGVSVRALGWQGATYVLGVLLAVVQYKEDLDLFTFPCQRSDASKIVPQRGGPTREHACIVNGPRSSGEGRGQSRTREAAD